MAEEGRRMDFDTRNDKYMNNKDGNISFSKY
jgi:hypothetical protein